MRANLQHWDMDEWGTITNGGLQSTMEILIVMRGLSSTMG
jgi:hypothetical protein